MSEFWNDRMSEYFTHPKFIPSKIHSFTHSLIQHDNKRSARNS